MDTSPKKIYLLNKVSLTVSLWEAYLCFYFLLSPIMQFGIQRERRDQEKGEEVTIKEYRTVVIPLERESVSKQGIDSERISVRFNFNS